MSNIAELKNPDSPNVKEINILEIMQLLPHRYPMLLIDKVIDIVGDESGTGIKNLTINEHFFAGHFPTRPVMPGVLIVEAMAQTSAVLVMKALHQTAENKIVYFMTVENARFRKPVVPGDTLEIKVAKLRQRGNVWKYKGEAICNGALCAEAVFTAMIADG